MNGIPSKDDVLVVGKSSCRGGKVCIVDTRRGQKRGGLCLPDHRCGFTGEGGVGDWITLTTDT